MSTPIYLELDPDGEFSLGPIVSSVSEGGVGVEIPLAAPPGLAVSVDVRTARGEGFRNTSVTVSDLRSS